MIDWLTTPTLPKGIALVALLLFALHAADLSEVRTADVFGVAVLARRVRRVRQDGALTQDCGTLHAAQTSDTQ